VTVRVRLFAVLRERAGSGSVEVDLPEGATVADAMTEISKLPALAGVLDRLKVAMAVNREYATAETLLKAEDEIALIPPVSGGADIHVRITEDPLSLDAVSAAVADQGAGAIVTFQGMPRDVSALDYEAYAEMAKERTEKILAEAKERHSLKAIAAEHRTGRVKTGEPSVIVAASAAHRGEAFAGAKEAIDRIKAEAPIWKREEP
jgi:molybdopterin converting factor subunit 1